jgi:hypothetical protein
MPPINLTYIHNDILTTDGDIITRQSGEAARLGVGNEDDVLTIVSGVPAWAVGGSGSGPNIWMPDAPPASAGSADDEFADNSGGVPSGWTEMDPDGHIVITENEQGVRMEKDSTAQFVGMYKAIPAGDFTIWTKLHFGSEHPAQVLADIALWEDATNTSGDIVSYGYDSNNDTIHRYLWNAYNSFGSSNDAVNPFYRAKTWYFRVRRNGTTYSFDYSYNGIIWNQRASGSLSFTPQHMGLGAYAVTATQWVEWSFFRYVASDIGVNGVAKGKRF